MLTEKVLKWKQYAKQREKTAKEEELANSQLTSIKLEDKKNHEIFEIIGKLSSIGWYAIFVL